VFPDGFGSCSRFETLRVIGGMGQPCIRVPISSAHCGRASRWNYRLFCLNYGTTRRFVLALVLETATGFSLHTFNDFATGSDRQLASSGAPIFAGYYNLLVIQSGLQTFFPRVT
jgi:hypothetical protein